MLSGLFLGGAVRLAKYGIDALQRNKEIKSEIQLKESEHSMRMQEIEALKNKDISIAELQALKDKSQAEISVNETERAWIEAVSKSQIHTLELMKYFEVRNKGKAIQFFTGIGNFFILLTNLGITFANVVQYSQKSIITVLIGYLLYYGVKNQVGDAPKEILTGMLFLFETIVSYNFFDKNLQKKKS